jgi:hypothetical protein
MSRIRWAAAGSPAGVVVQERGGHLGAARTVDADERGGAATVTWRRRHPLAWLGTGSSPVAAEAKAAHVDPPELADLLGERHRITGNNWASACPGDAAAGRDSARSHH